MSIEQVREKLSLHEKWRNELKSIYKDGKLSSYKGNGEWESEKVVLIRFTEPIDIPCFKKHNVSEIVLKTLFVRDDIIYMNVRRCSRGVRLDGFRGIDLSKIQSIQVVNDKLNTNTFQDVKNRLYDDKTWSNLTEEDFKHIYDPMIIKLRSIKSLFPSFVIECLEEAFKNKTKYSYCKRGTKRDYSVRTELGEDGIFRAWFSSEYSGTGNGSYWLLLNSTMAVWMEDD